MSTTVRSVRVELEASVAGYIRDITLAGAETDRAFSGIESRVGGANRSIGQLESSTNRLGRTSAETRVEQSNLGRQIERTGRSSSGAQASIDKYSGRLKTLFEAAVTLGPALLRLSAGALPAVTAGVAGIGAAAAGVGVAVLAFQGLGKALKALNTYELQPTAENLAKLRIEEEKLGPAGTEFLHFIDHLEPQLRILQNTARSGLFPGVEAGITDLLSRMPLVRQTVNRVSQEMGRLAAEAGSALSSDEWTPFFTYVRNEAAPTLDAFAHATGNVALGLANILIAFDPLSKKFTGGLEEMTARFADWSKTLNLSKGLDENSGFQQFLKVVQEAGPELKDFSKSTVQLFGGLVKASAPVGEVTLPILTGIANVLSTISNSHAGPALYAAAAGMIALNRAAASRVVTSLSTAFLDLRTSPNLAATAISRFSGVAKLAAGAAGMGLLITSLHETNRGLSVLEGAAGGALAGFSVGGPWGAAIGGAIGLIVNLGRANKETSQAVEEFTASLDKQTGALTENSRQIAVNALNKDNALGAAKALGISLALVTDAATGNTESLKTVNEQLDRYINVDLSKDTSGGQMLNLANTAVTLKDSLNKVAGVVSDGTAAWNLNAEAMNTTTQKTNDLKAGYDRVTHAAADMQAQLTELDDFLNKRGSFRSYQASLDELRASLKKTPHDFSVFTDKGRQNLEDLDKIISDAEAHLKTITDPSGKKQAGFLNDVINQLHGIAQTSPEAAAAVHAVLPELQKVRDANKTIVIQANNADALKKAKETQLALHDVAASQTRPRIQVDPGNSFGILGALRSELARIVSKTITVTVNHRGGVTSSAGGHSTDVPGGADGMTVPGARTPYGDKVLIHAAPGEEVISNRHGQADRFRADRAAGKIPTYAAGGTVEDRIRGTYTSRYRGYADGGNVDPSNDSTDSTGKKHKQRAPFTAFLPQDVANSLDGVKDAATRLDRALKGLQAAADKVKASYDKEKSKLDDLLSQRSSLASSIASAAVHDPFGNGVAGLDAQVEADTADIDSMTAALATLVKNGLDPKSALYQALAASMDVNTAQQLAQLSAGDLQSRAVAFQHRADEAGALGGTVAGQEFNAAIVDQTKATRELRGTLKDLEHEIHTLGDKVRQGAHSGTKDGAKDVGDQVFTAVKDANDDRGRRVHAGTRTGG